MADKKELKAKKVSLFGKITGLVFILAGTVTVLVMTCTGKINAETAKTLESSVILPCGFSLAGVFSTVDINILVDKFTKKNKEEQCVEQD